MSSLGSALKHAVRRLLRSPGFTAIALLTIAIGVGANSAIFSVIEGILLKPLPYPHPEELAGVWHRAPGVNLAELNASPSVYFIYREQSRFFRDVGLWNHCTATVTGLAEPEWVDCLRVTDGTLPILGIQPALGRWFSKKDDSPGSAATVMLMWGYWQRRFGGDRAILGRRIMVDGMAREVIGVMPQTFRFLDSRAVLILPLQLNRAQVLLGNFSYRALARLKPGATLEQANADVARMLPIVNTAFPPYPGMSVKMFEDARISPYVRPLKQDVVGDIGSVLWLLMGTIAVVLLIACANVANLLLVRAEGRRQELAIRAALGAGRGRVAAELLAESITLALAGGALGLGLAYAALRVLVAFAPSTLPRLDQISIDPAVLLFTLAVSLGSGLLIGFFPLLHYAGTHLGQALRGGDRTVSGSLQRRRARSVLVVTQVALALVLLVSSGLIFRSFRAVKNVHPGFTRPEEVQIFRIAIPTAEVREVERAVRLQHAIAQKIDHIPGVTSAGIAGSVTMDEENSMDPVFVEGRMYSESEIPPLRRFVLIGPGYFRTMGNPVIAGRDVTWTDIFDMRPVVLVSANLAREFWRDPAAAIGKRIRETPKGVWREVVGVVGDDRHQGAHRPPPATVYWPLVVKNLWNQETAFRRNVNFVVRSRRTGSEAFLREIRQAVWSANGNLPLANVRTLDELYRRSMARTSFALVMLAIAGGMALLLGIVGLYGVISYSVSQRTREIGIRIALGARNEELRRMIVGQGLALTGIGVACGVAAALAGTRLMSSLLFGVSATDPLTYAAVAFGLFGAAALASYVPSRKATAIDPVEALRSE
jgi:predicted permease